MRTVNILIVAAAFLFSSGLNAQDDNGHAFNAQDDKNHLLLTHPTVGNLKVMVKLVEREMLDLEGFRLVGIYHQQERYDYSRSSAFLDTLSYEGPEIYLKAFRDSIAPGELYRENQLSDDYRILFRESDGVVFFGGPDLPPQVYGEKTHLHTSIYDPYRHYFELSFLYHLLGGYQDTARNGWIADKPDYLVYGFCLGMQTMNVAAGGTMVQDIPSEVYNLHYVEDVVKMDPNRQHRNYYNQVSMEGDLLSGHFHRVHFKPGRLARRLKTSDFRPMVYSNHHQALDKVGRGFHIVATSLDGKVIEAIAHSRYDNVIGVQFHPEATFLYDDATGYRMSPDDAVSFTGPEVLNKSGSMEFHRLFWGDFERRLKRQ
jgi:putative glutamine amidotransferase